MSSKSAFIKTLQWTVPMLAVAAAVVIPFLESGEERHPRETRGETSAAGMSVPKARTSGTEAFPVEGVVLTEAGGGREPRIDATAAADAAATDGMRPDVQETIKPVVALTSFTNTVLGQPASPPFGPPRYLDVLVWDVKFPDAPVQRYGPTGRNSSHDDDLPPCDLHVIVDAMSSDVIQGFQDCP